MYLSDIRAFDETFYTKRSPSDKGLPLKAIHGYHIDRGTDWYNNTRHRHPWVKMGGIPRVGKPHYADPMFYED